MKGLAKVLRLIFGDITWNLPPWLKSLNKNIKNGRAFANEHPKKAAFALIGVLLLAVLAFAVQIWYINLPQPVRVWINGVAPELTKYVEDKDYELSIIPDQFIIAFGQSAAPIDKVGQSITYGIRIRPQIEGTWTWINDSKLSFLPKNDWPVGQEYRLRLNKKGVVAKAIRLETYNLEFSTASFKVKNTVTEFYEDPTDPRLKKVVATIFFTHPVDKKDFKKRLSLRYQQEKKGGFKARPEPYPHEVTFDRFGLHAYVHSDPITIPEKETSMVLLIDSGARASAGGPPDKEKIEKIVGIPSVETYFRISSTNISLVRNKRYEPEQVVIIQATADVDEDEIRKNLDVYVLPMHYPGDRKNRPYPWTNPEKINENILARSQRLDLDQIPTEKGHARLHSFKIKAEPDRYVYIHLSKGTTSYGGYLLVKPHRAIARVPKFKKEITILGNGSILSMSSDKTISIYSRDVEAIKFQVGRIIPEQIHHFISQTRGQFQNPKFTNSYRFNDENLTERFSEIRTLQDVEPGTAQYTAFDLSLYLGSSKGPKPRGLFLLKVWDYDLKYKRTTHLRDMRFILITDLGLLVKKAHDGSQDVFVQSIHNGSPVQGAKVEVLGKNGLPIISSNTDINGHVFFPPLSDFKAEKKATVYLIRSGKDLSFLPFDRADRQQQLSRFDVGGVRGISDKDRLVAYLFSDRGIYRPGDEFRIGLIVRTTDWSQDLSGLPLEVTIKDARGLVISKKKIRLPANGFDEIRHTTVDTSSTGTYSINVYIVKDGKRKVSIGSTTVQVQEFLPDRMKISARMSIEKQTGWVPPENLHARVTLQNLFGTAAVGRRITAKMILSPSYPRFSVFKDYHFYDPLRPKEGFSEDLEDGRTDDNGEVNFDLNLARFSQSTYRLRFIAQGYEAEGGRSVMAETSSLISPLEFLIGYKPDGDLYFINKRARRSVHLIAVNSNLKPIDVKDLKLSLVERKFVSVLTKQPNGTYRYESVKKESVLSEKPLFIPADGTAYGLPTNEPGDYALVIRDPNGLETNRIEFTVAGHGNLSRSLERNAELQLTLNKSDYEPGEEIEVQIKAPYVGAGLMTIERDKVYAYRWFKTNTTATIEKIRVPKNFEGNGYVSVSFIRGIHSDEVFMSPLSYGVVPFSVSRADRKVKLNIKTPDLAKPGEPFDIRYRTDRPTRIVIFAVDEGILQVGKYKTPDPLGHFFQKRALEVSTAQILDLILPEFKKLLKLSAPGGDAERALGQNLNPFKRKRDKPVAYWSGILEAGPKDKKIVYQLPDYFNGTLRVMAVAVSNTSVGVFEKKSTVRADFVISPNVPTFISPGDEFEVSVGVANNLVGSNRQVDLELTTSDSLEIIGPSKQKMEIASMREEVTRFRLRAKSSLGSANLELTASSNSKLSRRSIDLSIRPAMPYRMTIDTGAFKNTGVEIPTDRKMYKELSKFEVGVSPLPLALAHGLKAYLSEFPYGCTEQLLSKAFPAIILADRPEFGYTPKGVEDSIEHLIGTLRTRQNVDGGISLWATGGVLSDFSTVYAMHFLLEAKDRGYAVPSGMIENGMDFLKRLVLTEGNTLAGERLRAYSIYLMTRNNIITTNYVTALKERLERKYPETWKNDLAGIYLAGILQLLHQEKMAVSLISESIVGDKQEADYDNYYDGLIRDAQLLYILANHFPERLKKVSDKHINAMILPIKRQQFNTLSSAYTILAFDAYAKALGDLEPNKVEIQEIKTDGSRQSLELSKGLFQKGAFSDQATQVRISSKSNLNTFYVVTQAGFDLGLPQTEVKNGLEVFREFKSGNNMIVDQVVLGDEIEVHLKLRSLDRFEHKNIVIVDLLPGGFEVIRDRSTSVNQPMKSAWHPEYVDIREDRVVLYGTALPEVKEYVYYIKATNPGDYAVPPTFGESMYDRSIQAQGLGKKIRVEKP